MKSDKIRLTYKLNGVHFFSPCGVRECLKIHEPFMRIGCQLLFDRCARRSSDEPEIKLR